MTLSTDDRLYNLLPAIYRIRDEAQGGQLRALLAIIEDELKLIEADIDHLYDNWFIETCDDWVASYIGDLLAVQELDAASPRTQGQERRAYVANTLAYRQRKGTTAVLEQLARDLTGWYARAVEPFQLLAATQNMNHIRPNTVTVDLRRDRQPERIGTPFEQRAAYTAELRSRPRGQRGRYSLNSIALYLWRLQAYSLERAQPQPVKPPNALLAGRCFRFQAGGDYDRPLFNLPQTETDITTLAQEVNVPGILTRALLRQYLASGRFSDGAAARTPVQVWLDGQAVFPNRMMVDDLQQWSPLVANSPVDVAIDPELGRLTVLRKQLPKQVEISYTYGFNGDVGGGPYTRADAVADQVRSLRDAENVLIWEVASNPVDQPNPIAVPTNIWNQMAQAAQFCYDQTYIPLARVSLRPDGSVEPRSDALDSMGAEIRPQFAPGIVQDLTVVANPGEKRAIVYPGRAIDQDGNLLWLKFRYRVNVSCYRNQRVLLLISYQSERWLPRWRIRAIPESQADQYPEQTHIRLAKITTDEQGQIKQLDTRVRKPFAPGIIRGLHALEPLQLLFGIAPGKAITRQGRVLTIDENTTLDLSPYHNAQSNTGRTVILFLAASPVPEPPKLGAIRDVDTGIVYIRGNHSYSGNLLVQIPSGKHFWMVAANGDRPHLHGNLTVQSLATSDQNFSECLLEGILLEGKFTILPGYLERLQIAHCTLVPQAGGLEVEPEEFAPLPPDDTFSLLAIVFYALTLIQQLLSLGFGKNDRSPQQRLSFLSQFARHQLTLFSGVFQQTCTPCLEPDNQAPVPPPPHPPTSPSPHLSTSAQGTNDRLSISIQRSICGPITLPDTVPSLTIQDSIIDAAVAEEQVTVDAIAAFGTATEIQTTTVLGTTSVRSLEASDSIFTGSVVSLRRQVGCLRFCYVPEGSQTPRRYRCQPDLLLSEQITRPARAITALTSHPTTRQVFAATLGTGVFQFIDQHLWLPLTDGLTNPNVTALIALPDTLLAGAMGGDLFRAVSQTRSGTGSITSRDTQIAGEGTLFIQELAIGDRLLVGNQIRTVLAIQSDTELTIDAALDLPNATEFQFQHPRWTTTTAFTNTDITTLVAYAQAGSLTVLAGTAGGGIFRSSDAGMTWTAINQGLENLDVRAIAHNPSSSILFAGTRGGVFISSDNGNTWTQAIAAPPEDEEQDLPVTPPPLLVTALTLDPQTGYLFVGTERDGIFYTSDNGKHWTPANRNLTDRQITALASYSQPEQSGTRTILLAGTSSGTIFCATNLYATDSGATWIKVSTGLTDTDITTLLAWVNPPETTTSQGFANRISFAIPGAINILAGTRVGSVYRAVDGSNATPDLENQRWIAMNAGLNQVDDTLLLLNQLQPRFSSTRYGNASYAQFDRSCPPEICTGAEDGSEMGVFNYLKQPQREANLRASLKEYLRFGLTADIVFET
jgi:hypothetical protein